MRRFWTYVGAMMPLAAMTDQASGSLGPNFDYGDSRQLKDEGEPDGEGKTASAKDLGDAKDQQSLSPDAVDTSAGDFMPAGDDDPLNQEISGLLNELDKMNTPSSVDGPPMMDSPSSPGHYAPAASNGGSGGGSGPSVVVRASPDAASGDPVEEQTGTGGLPAVDYSETDVADTDSMFIALGGAAGGAAGTENDGDVDLEIIDYGQVTVAVGKAEFSATADWDGTGEPPALYAETFLDVYDADLVFYYHVEDENVSEGDGQYTQSSTLYVVAIDFEDDHPLANEFDMSDDNGYDHEGDPGLMLAASDGTPAEGYFGHPLLDGIPFHAFSQYFSCYNGEVHLEDSGADLNFMSTGLSDSSDPAVLAGDVTTIEDVASLSTLFAQTDHNEFDMSVSAFGPDTYTSIEAEEMETADISGIAGLAIGIA